jgi:LacI family transcriptional regulator
MENKLLASKVTIVEVAKKAQVSLGTVSRVINNDVHVAPETRERVSAVMQEMQYVANRQARGLKGMKTNVIGVLVPDLATSYIGGIMHGIDAELALHKFELMLFTHHRIAVKEASYVANMVQGMVDGLLLVLPRNIADYTDTLTRQNFPFVVIDHQGSGDPCPSVGATNWQGGYNATEYLIKQGHKRIGFITGSMDLGCSQDRLKGYRSALRTHHIPEMPELVYEGDFNQPDGYAGASAFLELPIPPTAIFASNDVMAMGVMDAVRNRNLRIPDDVSVVGFDNIPQSAMINPSLTTVQQPLEQMGRVATQMLLGVLKNPQKDVNRIELPTELIIRSSTSAPKNGTG